MMIMTMKTKILEYFRLIRFHSVSSETTIILLGALVMGQRDLSLLFVLFVIGLLGHILGYTLNDYADLKVDKKSDELKKKPLVSGAISKVNAIIIAITAAIFAFILTFIFFPYVLSFTILIFTAIVSLTYDFFGKKIPWISDYIVGGALFLFCLFGASTVTQELNSLIYIVCLIFFFDVVYINGIEGGIKDVDHDSLAGAKTIVTLMGAKVKNKTLYLSKKIIAYSCILRVIYIFLIVLLGMQKEINLWYSSNYLLQAVIIALIVLMIIVNYKFLNISTFDRSKIKKLIAAHSALSGIIIMVTLLPILGPVIVVFLLLFSVTWYTVFNQILYGKALQPRI